MAANLSEIIVVDVEATCWDKNDTRDIQGQQPNEIIEIGVAVLNMKSRQVTNRASIVIQPVHSKVSAFCTELTGWTQEQVDAEGLTIREAFAEFTEMFKPEGKVWCSYGEYDRWMLSSHTRQGVNPLFNLRHEENPFDQMRGHFNIKTLMALKHSLPREMGMSKALAYYGFTMEGRHHNGADDALNIAKIASRVLS